MCVEAEHFAVDRIEGDVAVLVGEDGAMVDVPLEELGVDVRAGVVLRASRSEAGQVDWRTAEVDEVEAERRLSDAKAILEELRGRDPGGDIVL